MSLRSRKRRCRAFVATVLIFFPLLHSSECVRSQPGDPLAGSGRNRYDASESQDPGNLTGAAKARRLRQEHEDRTNATKPKERTFSISEPWLSPDGKRLAAIVEDRSLTVADLRSRLRLRLRNARPVRHPSPEKQRAYEEERQLSHMYAILEEWVASNALAYEAERRGYQVAEDEIQGALRKLSEGAQGQAKEGQTSMMAFGIPQATIRAEIRDGLLIEKLVIDEMRARIPERVYRDLYETSPGRFHIPPRVRAFHVLYPLPQSMSGSDVKGAKKQMERLRKKLKKKDPDYEEIKTKPGQQPWMAGEKGWVSASAQLSPSLQAAFFAQPPGATTKVFEDGSAFHVVRILEREEGSENTYEAAVPQIENYLFENVKVMLLDALQPTLTIRKNAGGLSRWREVSEAEYRKWVASQQQAPKEKPPRGPKPENRNTMDQAPSATASSQKSPQPEPGPSAEPAIDLSILGPAE